MSSRLLKLLVVLAVVGVVSYIFYLNPSAIRVNLGNERVWEAPLALVLVVVFCLGLLLATAFSVIFAARHKLTEWRDQKRYRTWQDNQALMVSAREQIAAANYNSAAVTLSKIIALDPDNIIARILAADVFRLEGDTNAALSVLEEARQSQKRNIELLFIAAEIHAQSGNLTAAYDNTVMVLDTQPTNQFALSKLVDYSLGLSRYERAIEFQKELVRLASGANLADRQLKLAQIELDRALYSFDDPAKLRVGLEELLRRHRDFSPATAALANVERRLGNVDAAVKLWLKAYKQTMDADYLACVVETWLELEHPEKALAAARGAVEALGVEERSVPGRLLLANTLLYLEDLDQAQNEYSLLTSIKPLSPGQARKVDLLGAKLLRRRGKSEDAAALLLRLLNNEIFLPGDKLFSRLADKKAGARDAGWTADEKNALATQPPPQLSTP